MKKKAGKNAAAVELAKLRAKKLSPDRRSEIAKAAADAATPARAAKIPPAKRQEIARKAARARWGKQ